MKAFLKRIYFLFIVFFDICGANIVNLTFKIFKKNPNDSKYIIVYAPFRYKPWILNKIINDLKNSSRKKDSYKIFNTLLSVSIFRLFNGGNILSMHQSSLKKLYLSGFELKYISTYYTHSKLIQNGTSYLRKVNKVFCQNNYEYAFLQSSGISSNNLVSFPMGIHDNFLNIDSFKNFKKRDIDVIFSLRYFVENQHYKIRKRYEFIINLANLLSDSNFNVCIIGNGWNNKEITLRENILVPEVDFSQYPNFYQNSKIFCNVSLAEGGPISLLEAFSSGCIIFTTPTGLAFDLCVNDKLSHLMLFENQEITWFKKIETELNKKSINLEENLIGRRSKILKSSFVNLSKILEENIYSY